MKKSFYLDSEIVVIGLGYVGFPLAIKLSSVFKVIGFDISSNRINELKEGKDLTREIGIEKLKKIKKKFQEKRNERIKYLGENQSQEIEKRILLQTIEKDMSEREVIKETIKIYNDLMVNKI